MAVPVVTCSADVVVLYSGASRLIQLGATATGSPTAWEWTILSVPTGSTADTGTHGDFTNGVATDQNPELEIDASVAGTYVLQLIASNIDGPSNPLTDKEDGQQLIVVKTEDLQIILPNDYSWDWGKKYNNLTLRDLEAATVDAKVSANDTTRGLLEDKIIAGANITVNVVDEGANEKLQIASAGGGAFVSLSDTPSGYTGDASKFVRVNATQNGLVFETAAFSDLSDVPAYSGQENKALVVNGSADGIAFSDRTFLNQADTPASYSGEGLKLIRVNVGATGLEFTTAAADNFAGLTDTPADYTGGVGGYFVVVNSTPDGLEFIARTFLNLTDAPSSYSGSGNKLVAVKAGADGLEFIDAPTGSFIGLTDTPTDYTGDAGKHLRVNSTPDGVEFADPTFLEGTDTPASYSAQGGKIVRVNATPDGLEFVDLTFILAGDTPANYTAAAGKFVRVNSTPDGLEFADAAFLDLSDTPAAYGAGDAGKAVVVNVGEDGLTFETINVTDEKVKVSATDDTTQYLEDKLAAGTSIGVATTGSPTEQITISNKLLQGQDELVSTGTETSVTLSQTPVAAAGMRAGVACDMYRNGVLMRHVATLGTNPQEWLYATGPARATFVASGGADLYEARYTYDAA